MKGIGNREKRKFLGLKVQSRNHARRELKSAKVTSKRRTEKIKFDI